MKNNQTRRSVWYSVKLSVGSLIDFIFKNLIVKNQMTIKDARPYHFGIAILFSIFAMILNYLQSRRGIPIIDYAYQANAAYRIFRGDVPYRDFFLVVTPGTYYLMALLMKITGGYNHMIQLGWTMVISALLMVICFLLYLKISKSPNIALFMLIPLLFTGHSIYAFPNYDINVFLIVLASLLCCVLFESNQSHPIVFGGITGILVASSFLFKQNIGLAFIPCWIVYVLLTSILSKRKEWWSFWWSSLIGIISLLGIFFIWLYSIDALKSFYYQTYLFPKQMRDPISALFLIRDEYTSFLSFAVYELKLFVLLVVIVLGFSIYLFTMLKKKPDSKTWEFVQRIYEIGIIGLLVWSFYALYGKIPSQYVQINTGIWFFAMSISVIICLFNLILVFRSDQVKFTTFLPFLCIVLILASSLSQRLWGSSYGMWPIYFLLMAWIFGWLKEHSPIFPWSSVVICCCIFITFFLGWIVESKIRLGFVRDLNGQSVTSTIPNLKGFTTPGIWIPEFDSLIQYINKTIPLSDEIAYLPGEDLLFEVTGRKNPLYCIQLLQNTCEKSFKGVFEEIESKNIAWVIIKTSFQFNGWVNNASPVPIEQIPTSYQKIADVGIYSIYKHITDLSLKILVKSRIF